MGRATERRELERLLESAHGGRGERLLLVGDPGMGTSALLAWFMECAASAGRPVASLTAGDLIDAAALTHRLAALPAACVIVDDAHRLPTTALTVLSDAMDTLASVTVVAAAHARSQAAHALSSWPALPVGPLDADESARLIELTLGREHSHGVLYELADALGGNPLALRQVPALLSPDEVTGRRPLPLYLPVPPALDDAWGAIVDALDDGPREALLDVVVCGPQPPLLAAMRADAPWCDGDLAAVADVGLVRLSADGSPMVVHPIVGHVVAAHTPTVRVLARHRRAAELGAGLGLPPQVVVGHFVHSTTTADDAVAAAIDTQAVRAEAMDQLVVASAAWQAAARLSTSSTSRITRGLHALHLVIAHGLDYAGTDTLLDLLAGEQLEAECALWVEWLLTLQRSEADPAAATTAQWSTIRSARVAAPDTLRGLLWDAAMNSWSLGDAESGLLAAREYADVERTLPTMDAVEPPWTGMGLLAAAHFQLGEVARATPLRAQAIAAAATTNAAEVPFDRLLSTVFLDDLLLDTTPAAMDRLLVAAQRAQDQSAAIACLDGIRAWRYRAAGNWLQAHRMLERGRPVAAKTRAIGPQLGMAALTCELAALQGDDETLLDEGARLRCDAERIGDRRRLATLDRAMGMRALASGRLDEAAVWLMAAADVAFLGRGLRDAVIPSRVDLVEVLLRQGDIEAARERADAVCRILSAMDDPLARAYELRVRALVSDDLDAFRIALAAHAEARDPFEEARTRLLLGERLRRDRQRSAARRQLLAAHRLFDTLGANPWAARVNTEIRATGTATQSCADLTSLTPQESAVARAVAAGHSNREVAEELFLSPRTVEYHLASVYRKLGLRGRTALARKLVDD